MTPDELRSEIDSLRKAVAVLSDGKWDRRDVFAIVSILGGLAGLASAGVLLAKQIGLL